jgi:molecular chaperone GrpE
VTDPKLTEGRGPAQAGDLAREAGDVRPENRGVEGAAGGAVPRDGREEHVSADRIAELERERDEYLDSLQRLKAEFDNFRKRTARESAAQSARAGEALVKELLPVLDDLERGLVAAEERRACIAAGQSPAASAPEELEAKLEEGVRLVHRALADVLARAGLSEIETGGAFDPHVHEALLTQPVEGADPGAVVEVLQKGYRLGDRVLRPARVVVAE